jgi:hypothetical protein
MAGWQNDLDKPIQTMHRGDLAPGLEGLPRMDLGPAEAAVPALVDLAIRGPVVLTRHGEEAFVLLPLDIYRRIWGAISRPPVVDAPPAGDSAPHAAPGKPRRGRKMPPRQNG